MSISRVRATQQLVVSHIDPLLQQNGFSDIFNREFNNPVRLPSVAYHRLPDFRYCSLPVSSTSVVQIAAKLYITTDKVDAWKITSEDLWVTYMTIPLVLYTVWESREFSVPRDSRRSVAKIASKNFTLKLTVNWKLPYSLAPSSSKSHQSPLARLKRAEPPYSGTERVLRKVGEDEDQKYFGNGYY
ncbi:hypothetical protein Tco_0948297 [Tanacetum coccineum]